MTLNLNRANLSLDPLNTTINATVEQASLIKHASDEPRGYLGASLIGDECSRKIQFEWLTGSTFPARVRSIFERGHYFEIESKQQLVDAGFVFEPSVEKLGFVAADGLMAGHADGVIVRVPAGIESVAETLTTFAGTAAPSPPPTPRKTAAELAFGTPNRSVAAPSSFSTSASDHGPTGSPLNPVHLNIPALWEHKALNAKNFRAVERDGLAKVFPKYAAQVALYQAFLNILNPALVTIVNADTCERLHFTVEFDARRVQEASDRAVTVIKATCAGELLSRLDPSLEDFRCRMCSHLERCRRHD